MLKGGSAFGMAQEIESAERVISPYEADARASRKRDTEWVG